MTGHYAFSVTIRALDDGAGSIDVYSQGDMFTLPRPGDASVPLTVVEILGAVLELITVDQLAAATFDLPRPFAQGMLYAIEQHIAFAANIETLASAAARRGTSVNVEALAPVLALAQHGQTVVRA